MILRMLVTIFLAQLLVTANAKENKTEKGKSIAEDHIFTHGGKDRTYKMHRPENLADNAPLLFVLHGMGSSSNWSYQVGFNELADEHGFLVVYPQSLLKRIVLDGGSKSGGKEDAKVKKVAMGKNDAKVKKDANGNKWEMGTKGEMVNSCEEGSSHEINGLEYVCRDGKLTSGIHRWNNDNDDNMHDGQSDVEFLSALAMSLQKEYHLNPEKTFVTGFSNGGYMSYTLMCQAGDVFNAAAPVAGLIDEKVFQSCAPSGPKPLLHIHGTADWMVPITGNRDKNGIKSDLPGAQEIVAYFADLNDAVTMEMVKVSDNTTLTIYKPENDGAEVRYYRIENHDHIWPGGDQGSSKKINDESGINATELIWAFFSRF